MQRRHRFLAAASFLALLTAMPANAASARDGQSGVGLAPVGTADAWFDLELEPGVEVDLEVELANHGPEAAEVRTYVADVYSLINGGMGVGLADELAVEPVTGWIDYAPSTPVLSPESAQRHEVGVRVPADTEPGQYIAALVLEYRPDELVPAATSTSGSSVGIDQVARQAVAINITVPGPVVADLTIGTTTHQMTGPHSSLRTELHNTGDLHLRPAGHIELTGPGGEMVAHRDVELAIVYADSATHLEAVLDTPLAAGMYTMTTHLEDAAHDVAASTTSTFEIEAAAANASSIVDQVRDAVANATSTPWVLVAGAAVVALLGVGAGITFGRRRRPT